MANVEREQVIPLGIKLAQATQKAVNEWEFQRRAITEKKAIGSGHPRPSREKTWLRQVALKGRGKFIGEKLNPILDDPGFSEILGNHISSYLPQGESPEHQELDEVKKSLKRLNENQLNLVKRFYLLRVGLDKPQADLARKELNDFSHENLDQIPDNEEFLIGLFRSISNLYPDPQTVKK